MKNHSVLSSQVSRRGWLAASAAGIAARNVWGQAPSHPVTSASVPDDPDAPAPQEGTQPEAKPFSGNETFIRRDVRLAVEPFDQRDVRLLAGPFLQAQEANRQLMSELPSDRLLYNFRVNAGLPSSATPLGGWEKPSSEVRGHFVGHFLSACALSYRNSGDAAVKAQGDELVAELAKCQDRLPGGYLSAFPTSYFDRLAARQKVWAPYYTVHKIMAGLLDMHTQCDNAQALTALARMSDWVDRWTSAQGPDHMQSVLDTEYGGMAETLYNLAAVTGDSRWVTVGDRFTKQRFFNPLALHQDELRGLHTNTHIPQVIGAARRYELSGDDRYRSVAEYFWREVTTARTYATGGTSNNEGWLVGPNQLAKELSLGDATNECCCAYNMLKLTRKLYTWSGDPRYFDYYERVLLNHRLGTIDPRQGVTQYYLGIVPGSWRTFGTVYDSFWCCNGTGVEEYSKLNDSIYFHDASGIYVNLFIPSELYWREKGVRLRQQTRFPEEDSSTFVFDLPKPVELTLNLRVPGWLGTSPTISVNGRDSEVSARPGSYAALRRTWKNGDRVSLRLPLHLRAEPLADDPTLQAFLYGPLVLGGLVAPEEVSTALVINQEGPRLKKRPAPHMPELRAGNRPLEQLLRPGHLPLTFEATEQSVDLTLQPFWQITRGRCYSIYWRMA